MGKLRVYSCNLLRVQRCEVLIKWVYFQNAPSLTPRFLLYQPFGVSRGDSTQDIIGSSDAFESTISMSMGGGVQILIAAE